MKSLQIGFEVNAFNGGMMQSLMQVPADMILRGYHLDLAMMSLNFPSGLFAQPPNPQWAEVLFFGLWVPTKPTGWLQGNVVAPVTNSILQGAASQALHPDTEPATDSVFATAILKTWAPAAVNKSLDASGLALTIPAGNWIVLEAAHGGYVQDFELQGTLFYD